MTTPTAASEHHPDYSPARTLVRAALQHPERTSLVWGYEGDEWSLSRSALAVRRLVSVFSDQINTGVLSAGDRIAVIGPNSPWHFLLHVAGSWVQTVTVPLSPRLPVAQLVELLVDSSPRIVVTTAELAHALQDALSNISTSLPNTQVSNGEKFFPRIWTFDDLAALEASASPFRGTPPSRSNELAAIVYTSGSSGTPRGVELTHAQMWWGSLSFRDGFEYSPGTDVIGVCAPLSHIGGFNGTTLDAFAHGGTVVVLPGFEPVSVLRAVEKYHITQMFLVPVMCHLLADAQEKVQADLSSYRNPLIGGDAMGIDLEKRLRGMGLAPIHVWGMTETAGAGAMLSADVFAQHAGAIGLPFPYIDLRIVTEAGRVLEPGVDTDVLGEIQVRGPGVSAAYYNRPIDTTDSRLDGWLRTGDLGTYDNDGFVHMAGRASRMIHTAGEMVAPRRVEEAVRALAFVADVLVVGLPDERWGQVVSAVIVPAAGEAAVVSEADALPRALTPEELRAVREGCEAALAPWESVRVAAWVDALPLTSTGKPNPGAAQELLRTLGE